MLSIGLSTVRVSGSGDRVGSRLSGGFSVSGNEQLVSRGPGSKRAERGNLTPDSPNFHRDFGHPFDPTLKMVTLDLRMGLSLCLSGDDPFSTVLSNLRVQGPLS